MTTTDISSVVSMLKNIMAGGEVTFEEVQALEWTAPPELDRFLQRIYRQLQIFASDDDIRGRDKEYDSAMRQILGEYLQELIEKSE